MGETIVKTLNIIEINVNSLIRLSRRYDLSNFIEKHKPDIVLLNETKLNNRHKICFKDYAFIRKDRLNATRGGGTAILMKNGTKYKYYANNIINSFKFLETCIIQIPFLNNKTLFVISAYYPSGNNSQLFKTELHQLFQSLNLQNTNHYYILAGDLNCKHSEWCNSTNNTKGNMLREWLSCNEMNFRCTLYASATPSYPRCGSYLDICISDSRLHIQKENNSMNCLKTLNYDSDHNAIQIKILKDEYNSPLIFFKETPASKYNYKKTNWKKFRNNILNELNNNEIIPNNRNLTNSEINFYLLKLNDMILKSIEKSVPKFKSYDSTEKYINKTIRLLQKEKSKTLTIIKKYNRLEHFLTTAELNLHKNKLKLIRKLLDENFVISTNNFYQTKIKNIGPKNSSNLFSESKKQFRNANDFNISVLKIPQEDEYLIRNADIRSAELERDSENNNDFIIKDDNQILNVIGSYIESVHSFKESDPDNAIQTTVDDFFSSFLQMKTDYENNQSTLTTFNSAKKANEIDESNADHYLTTRDSIFYIFNSLKRKLSSGVDNIPNIILRNIPETMILSYCTLFNNILNNSYFPYAWKEAKVVILPKKGKDSSNPTNLRAISLLPNISKVFEVCVNNIIVKLCKKNDIINNRQFGFKYKHSTVHAVHQLVSSINWNLNKQLCTGACLIDFEKAFDSIWIPGLIYKLNKYKFPIHLILLIHNMLNNKTFRVCNKENTCSKKFVIVNGLQQGTVNSPILFNIFIFELVEKIDNLIAFADDIIVYHAGSKIQNINHRLQTDFCFIEKYAYDWKMKINISKCETILFRPPVGKCNNNVKNNWKDFGLKSKDNENIPNKPVVKYLGIHLDKFLYFNKHIDLQLIKARKAFFLYKNLFFSKHLDEKVKILLYQSLVRPILTYGCQIWFNISPSYMEKIRVFERKCLRACTSLYRSPNSQFTKFISNKKLYNTAKISRIDNFIIHLIRNHILKSFECRENNLILAPYYVSDEYILNTLLTGYVPPEAFLYLDGKGYIQNDVGIPIFFHIYRRANNKTISCKQLTTANCRFDTSFYSGDKNITPNLNFERYWWLTE